MASEIRIPADVVAPVDSDLYTSGVSWGAVLAGAAGAAALSYALVILGFGLGLSSISPWAYAGASATTIGVATILWLSFTQIASSSLGGYLAGRLRVKWASVHTDEVYFRDTAHGFLSWAVASLVVAAFLASTLAGVLSGGATIAATAAGGFGAGAGAAATATVAKNSDAISDASGYYVDMLLRGAPATSATSDTPSTDGAGAMASPRNEAGNRAEVARIFASALASGDLPAADRQYLGQLVARRAGIDPAQGEQRVNDVYAQLKQSVETAKTKAKEAADTARKVSAGIAIWMFISLLLGAFFGSFAATLGGRHRETYSHLTRASHL
ncbi:MAG: hypothetical protein ABIS07_12675 [Dokdonella sp.]